MGVSGRRLRSEAGQVGDAIDRAIMGRMFVPSPDGAASLDSQPTRYRPVTRQLVRHTVLKPRLDGSEHGFLSVPHCLKGVFRPVHFAQTDRFFLPTHVRQVTVRSLQNSGTRSSYAQAPLRWTYSLPSLTKYGQNTGRSPLNTEEDSRVPAYFGDRGTMCCHRDRRSFRAELVGIDAQGAQQPREVAA